MYKQAAALSYRRLGNHLPLQRYDATSGNAEFSCVGPWDRKGHGPTMHGPACTLSDTTAGV